MLVATALQTLGARIRARRVELELSQDALARLAGLHPTYISRIEAGLGNISVARLLPLAKALRTSAGDLLSGLK